MNRPEAKNAINLDLHNALCAAWDDVEKDDAIDVVIITGTGDAFCAGMDLKTHVTDYVNASPGKVAEWVELGLGGHEQIVLRRERLAVEIEPAEPA